MEMAHFLLHRHPTLSIFLVIEKYIPYLYNNIIIKNMSPTYIITL